MKIYMKKITVFAFVILMAIVLGGCGKKEEQPSGAAQDAVSADTLGGRLVLSFRDEMEKGSDRETCVKALIETSEMDCGTMDCAEGYLNGFSEQIEGFTSATMFSPYIGSIPFVGYVFETEDPEALKEKLLGAADPAWNICTEAEETVSDISGKYVFFAMCPGEDF